MKVRWANGLQADNYNSANNHFKQQIQKEQNHQNLSMERGIQMGRISEIPVYVSGSQSLSVNPGQLKQGLFGNESPTSVSKVLPIDDRKYVDGFGSPYQFGTRVSSKRNLAISSGRQIVDSESGVSGSRSVAVSANFQPGSHSRAGRNIRKRPNEKLKYMDSSIDLTQNEVKRIQLNKNLTDHYAYGGDSFRKQVTDEFASEVKLPRRIATKRYFDYDKLGQSPNNDLKPLNTVDDVNAYASGFQPKATALSRVFDNIKHDTQQTSSNASISLWNGTQSPQKIQQRSALAHRLNKIDPAQAYPRYQSQKRDAYKTNQPVSTSNNHYGSGFYEHISKSPLGSGKLRNPTEHLQVTSTAGGAPVTGNRVVEAMYYKGKTKRDEYLLKLEETRGYLDNGPRAEHIPMHQILQKAKLKNRFNIPQTIE